MARRSDSDKVKSARRVLEVLEFFNAERRQATVMEVSRAYGYPQSSTSQLLSCLADMGFLHRDRRSRTFRPTMRVATLGAWVQPCLVREGRLLALMDELAAAFGAAVLLAGVVGVEAQVFHAVAPAGGVGPAPGERRSLVSSVIGKSLLLTHDRSYVAKLVRRLNAGAAPAARVDAETLLAELDVARWRGFAFQPASEMADGACAVLLPQSADEEPLALALEFDASVIRSEEECARALRTAVAAHLGPSRSTQARAKPDAMFAACEDGRQNTEAA